MAILDNLPVVPQQPQFFSQLRIARYAGSGIPKRSQVLAGIKAETIDISKPTTADPIQLAAVSLGRVFDDF